MPSNIAYLDVHGLLQAMEMQQKMVTAEAFQRFGSSEAYYRFSVGGIDSGSLEDWTTRSIEGVDVCMQTYLGTPARSAELDAAAGQLAAGRGSITLGHLSMS